MGNKALAFIGENLLQLASMAVFGTSTGLAIAFREELYRMASEHQLGFFGSVLIAFSLGVSVGLALRIPGRIIDRMEAEKARIEKERRAEKDRKVQAELDRTEFLKLDLEEKLVLVSVEMAGGQKLAKSGEGSLDTYGSLFYLDGLVNISEFGDDIELLVITERGKRVLDNSRDLVDAFKKVQEENLEG